MENLHRDLSKERGREQKRKSRDLRKRSLKTDRETESGEPTKGYMLEKHLWRQTGRQRAEILHRDVSKEKEGMKKKEEEQRY